MFKFNNVEYDILEINEAYIIIKQLNSNTNIYAPFLLINEKLVVIFNAEFYNQHKNNWIFQRHRSNRRN